MKPRYYVHMGPRAAENVSAVWKAAHITVFFLILVASVVATACTYNILNMYDFNCIIYAKVSFQQTHEQKIKEINAMHPSTESADVNATNITGITEAAERVARDVELDCDEDPTAPGCEHFVTGPSLLRERTRKRRIPKFDWEFYQKQSYNDTTNTSVKFHINNTGFLNLRKTVFASVYMCDLMWFSPLASMVMSIFLGTLIAVGGKGGAGSPGDLLPNPWICVYPFLGFCAFMMIFSFISNNLFQNGLEGFCEHYVRYTGDKWCNDHMDQFNVQFTPKQKGPPRPFYKNYNYGRIGVQATSGLWVIQTLVYVLRIFCLADFSLYLTRIRLKDDEKQDPKMANVVMKMMDSVDLKNKRI